MSALLEIMSNNVKVYCKPTSKNDQIYFYSNHYNNTKKGVKTVFFNFYLRGLCICSSEYLNDEFNLIENSFINILFPKHFIFFGKSKSLKILYRNQSQYTLR